MAFTFPKVKKSFSLKLCTFATALSRLNQAKHETNITVVSPSEWTSTAPVVATSESIEPNDDDLELKAIGYTFSKIF